jgi:hypothetical protein
MGTVGTVQREIVTGTKTVEQAWQYYATDGDSTVVRRTTSQPVRSIKGQRPWTATSIS